jgi:hypothetical protein
VQASSPKEEEMAEVKKFRKRPVVIEAMQFRRGMLAGEVDAFVTCDTDMLQGDGEEVISMAIVTLEGEMEVADGDWIIKGVKGEFYPCKPDIFEATYEPAPEAGA